MTDYKDSKVVSVWFGSEDMVNDFVGGSFNGVRKVEVTSLRKEVRCRTLVSEGI